MYTSRARGLALAWASPQGKQLAAQEKPAIGCHPNPPPCPHGQFWPRLSIQELIPKPDEASQSSSCGGPPGSCRTVGLAIWAASLWRSSKLLLCFASLHWRQASQVLCPPPAPLPSPEDAVPPPRGTGGVGPARIQGWAALLQGPGWDHLPARCLLPLLAALAEGRPSGGV